MGYFADIIKDSRQNISARALVPGSQPLSGQPTAVVKSDDDSASGSRAINVAGRRATVGADSSSKPSAASPIETRAELTETAKNPEISGKRLQRAAEEQNAQTRSSSAKENTALGTPIDATAEHIGTHVIQRKTLAASTLRASTEAGSTSYRVQTQHSSSPRRLVVDVAASASNRSSRRTPNAAAPQPRQTHQSRSALPVENHRRIPPGKPAANELSKKEAAPIETEIAPTKQRSGAITKGSAAPTGESQRVAEEVVPIEATLRDIRIKPDLPVPSIASTRPKGTASTAPANSDSTPCVQIGQVNVVVEESRVPPQSQPGDQPGNNLASRMFLRSL